MKRIFLPVLLLLFVFVIGNAQQYESVNGLVTIEAENLNLVSNWNEQTQKAGYTGDGYITWTGNNFFNAPGNGIISTKIKINEAGKYKFEWYNRIGEGTNTTEFNDTWLRFPDASDYYGEKNGNRVYPKGTGKTPVPNGSGADGWFKVYSSGATNWRWSTYTSDNDGHQIYAEFDSPGVYTMEISARSKLHLIDRIVMYKSSVANPKNLNNSETVYNGSTPPPTNPPTTPPTGTSVFTLHDVTTDSLLGDIVDGGSYYFETLPIVTIIADYSGVDKVVLTIEGVDYLSSRTEGVAPYVLFGDINGDYLEPDVPLSYGTYTVTAEAMVGSSVVETNSVTFTLTDVVPTPPTVPVEGDVIVKHPNSPKAFKYYWYGTAEQYNNLQNKEINYPNTLFIVDGVIQN